MARVPSATAQERESEVARWQATPEAERSVDLASRPVCHYDRPSALPQAQAVRLPMGTVPRTSLNDRRENAAD